VNSMGKRPHTRAPFPINVLKRLEGRAKLAALGGKRGPVPPYRPREKRRQGEMSAYSQRTVHNTHHGILGQSAIHAAPQ
jgi:hypothetical protein